MITALHGIDYQPAAEELVGQPRGWLKSGPQRLCRRGGRGHGLYLVSKSASPQ